VPKSPAVSLASLSEAERKAFLGGLSENALAALPWLWSFWAHPGHQLEPAGDWQCWVILGGRGAGKTRAGAEWVRAEVEGPVPQAPGRARRIALVGETIDQARAVMVEGESGLMAVSPPDRRPELQASRNRLVWPNGAEATLLSAANPEAMRGPQFDGAWSDETGCPAVDLGANEPNLFADGKSSESAIPAGSLGVRDDEMQRRFLQAKLGYWAKTANMPVSTVTGNPMIQADRIFVWTWDSRPWPDFPVRGSIWADGAAHRLGHWITGRVSASGLAEVVAEICRRAGVTEVDVSDLHGVVDGYVIERNASAREALQPLMLTHGFDAFESGGKVVFRMRGVNPGRTLEESGLVAPKGVVTGPVERLRNSAGSAQDVVRLSYIQAESDFRVGGSEVRLPGGSLHRVAESSLPVLLAGSKAQQLVDRWLAESWRSRDHASFILPPSEITLEPGDVVEIARAGTIEAYRIERIVDALGREAEAVRTEAALHLPHAVAERNVETGLASPPGPIRAIFMDLPLAAGQGEDHLPRLAVTSDPWADRVPERRLGVHPALGRVAALGRGGGRFCTA